MYWPVVVILVSSMLVACGPDKGGGETGSSGASSSSSAGTDSGGSGGSTGPAVTTGSGACAELGCGKCDGGCVPEPVCVEGEVVCDCANCNESMSEAGTSTSSTTGTSGSGTGSTGEGGTTGETTGSGIVCGGDMPAFPEFDRSCMGEGDCSLVFHQVDCCGSLVAWGLSNDAAKAFAEAEAVCEAMYPACECATQPTLLDDGKSTEDNQLIGVVCEAGSCSSVHL